MPFDLDPKADTTRARVIALGGRELKCAPLTLRQIIAVSDMLPKISAAASTHESIELLADFILLALRRTYPGLTRDDLLELETTVEELRAAADIVLLQAGGKKADPAGGTPLGEAKAASDTTVPIGTSSSPSSALN